MQTLFGTIFGMLAMTYKSFIFYSCNAKLVLYNINYLIHAFLKYPKFAIFNLSVYEINPFRKFQRGHRLLQVLWAAYFLSFNAHALPIICHVALVDRF